MKIVNTALLCALTVVASATLSNAQTRIYFNGSTAFRGAAEPQIKALFDSSPAVVFGYSKTSESGANAQIFSGYIGGVPYIIKASWTGSESGLQAIVADSGTGVAINFIADVPALTAGGTTTLTTGGTPNLLDPTTVTGSDSRLESHVPDVAFSDTYQTSSQFYPGNKIKYGSPLKFHTMGTATAVTTGSTGGAIGDGIVGIIPFVFATTSTAFTNIDTSAIVNLYAYLGGVAPRSMFTGVVSDTNAHVYATGRNPDSGTRLNAMVNNTLSSVQAVTQFEPVDSTNTLISATGSTIASIRPWDADTVNTIAIPQGNSGYNSGGSLAGALGSVTSGMVAYSATGSILTNGTNGDIVAYLGVSDFTKSTFPIAGGQGGGQMLSFNGVPYSRQAVEQGLYKFWGYEHIYVNPLSAAPALTQANRIASALVSGTTVVQAGGLDATDSLANMKVSRSGSDKDGQPITFFYTY